MNQKYKTLALWCLLLALVTFVLSYLIYHFTLPGGFFTITLQWQPTPGKPFVTQMVADLGVLFLFGSVMSLLIGRIFFPEK